MVSEGMKRKEYETWDDELGGGGTGPRRKRETFIPIRHAQASLPSAMSSMRTTGATTVVSASVQMTRPVTLPLLMRAAVHGLVMKMAGALSFSKSVVTSSVMCLRELKSGTVVVMAGALMELKLSRRSELGVGWGGGRDDE